MKPNYSVIVDDFLEQPLAIRDIALNLEYKSSYTGIYAGKRTLSLNLTHEPLYTKISKKILSYYNLDFNDYNAEMCFHITEGKFGKQGWVHSDYPVILSSVLYLNPSINGIDSGTSLFDKNPGFSAHSQKEILTLKKSFIQGIDCIKEKEKFNSNYTKTVVIGGKFNRLVIYPGNVFHTGEGYFGNNVCDSRLTLVSFVYKKE